MSEMNKVILAAAIFFMLSACASTPIGKLTEDEFVTKEVLLNKDYQSAYRNLISGLRGCPVLGVPFGNIYTDIGEAHIDLYMGGGDNSARASKHAYGTISLKEVSPHQTKALYRLVKRSIYRLSNDAILSHWQALSDGIDRCPD